MASADFIANTAATLVLAGMMFLPFVNILVGSVVGGGIGGFAGFFVGALVAGMLTALEIWLLQRQPLTGGSEVGILGQSRASPRHFGRKIVSVTDWRQLKRGLAKRRIVWTGGYRRAA
jgi:hypothetical protein